MTIISYFLYLYCVFLLISTLNAHAVKEIISGDKQIITGYINQDKTVAIPFKKCFKAEPELQANKRYINFKPTRVGFRALKTYSLKNEGSNISTLQELRSPTSYKHRNLLIFDDYLMIFFAPNVILIVQENANGFEIKNKYYLQNLNMFDQFKMYKFGDRGILVIYNKQRVYVLNQIDYQDYSLPEISTIIHLQQLSQNGEFFAAEFMKGLTHYKLNQNSKKIEIVKRYDAQSLGFDAGFTYIVDVNLRYFESEKLIFVLDADLGVIQINLNEDKPTAKVVISQKRCESFDTIQKSHFVLLCQNQGHSAIVEAYQYYDKKAKQNKYRKIQPIFHSNYLNDLHLTQNYYVVFSYKSIHVFWNTEKNRLPETLETQSEIVIPGLQTFTIQSKGGQNYMYTVEGGQLNKYQLSEEKAVLSLKSDLPLVRVFKLYVYGSCDDLQKSEQNKDKVQACKVTKDIMLKVTEEDYARKQDFSISASIVVILITVFLLVIWICLKKYKGLERQARKVLESYQRKRSQRRSI